jgi:signal-transduction protein with cAMP-binding, CBS, and nucleotidyltransferase domain
MPIADIARSSVVTAEPDASAASLAEQFESNNVGSVVITEGTSPVGIVTDRDLALTMAGDGADPSATVARDIMSEDLVTAEASDGAFDLCSTMCDSGVRRMPIVEDGDLVGIVTLDDMLQLLADELQHLSTVVARESPPY